MDFDFDQFLNWFFFFFPFGVALVLAAGFCVLFVLVCSGITAGLVLVATTHVLNVALMGDPLLKLGILIYLPDLSMVVIAAAAALRWMNQRGLSRLYWPWLVLVAVFSVGLMLGLAKYGTSAGVQARGDFYALAAGCYALTFAIGRKEIGRAVMVLACAALALVLLTVYRWVVFYLPIPELLPPGGVYNTDGAIRVVGSFEAVLMLEASIALLFFSGLGVPGGLGRVLAPVLLGVVLALQHRSVWLAGIVGVCASLLLARSTKVPMWQQVALALIALSAAMAPIFFSSTLAQQVDSSAKRAASGQGTVTERFDNWKASIEKWAREGPVSLGIGSIPGGDTTRYVYAEGRGEVAITYGTHNEYVNRLTGSGLLGVAAWVVLTVRTAFALKRRRQVAEDAMVASFLLVILAVQLCYYIAYNRDFMQFLLLGLAASWAREVTSSALQPSPTPVHAMADKPNNMPHPSSWVR